ncbi:purine and uridine phosphorylase [Aureobasidium pullulans]|uniref:Purine and uridine phosphorylase n=1 Tax=Aureobasidium pullulans TaxID=5580 RepID=A0A4S9EQU5_AURPU|nr:purine and uridine phosphorylase [Aureobasidium pullulans]
MSNPEDYTVGWICAISTEFTAAQLFLDKEHDLPNEISSSDTNHYKLGEISGHNVVVAVLPDGEYGVGSAANVVTNLLRSFKNVRVGLMVGIGGGAPTSKNDIRLGDVVVSSPKNGTGGVYQYDFGKTIQGVRFEQTGFLDQPSATVRAALNGLKTKHDIHGHKIRDAIESILSQKPRLKKKGYTRPEPGSDLLFISSVVHSQYSESACMDSCAKQSSSVVFRRPRDDDDDDPAIHYGVVASGNQLMKDAVIRDKLANEKAILCFEMEAAGLMNHLPCMIIRGICDYSDSHKNKEWQGYAAMTAAAYAKELLLEIHPRSVKAEKKLAMAVEQLSGVVGKVGSSVEQLKAFGSSNAITAWLDAPDPSVNFNRAHDAHHTGTGQWFFKTGQFLQWRREENSFLWLHGMPGCGKTVLSSTIVRRLAEDGAAPVLFFYFDFSEARKQQFEAMIRSFLVQIYHKAASSQASIRLLYDSHSQGCVQPDLELIEDTLRSILSQLKNVDIVIDALDESQTLDRVLQWCKKTHDCKTTNLRLLVTSRTQVVQWPKKDQLFSIQSAEVNNDIRSYVSKRVHSDEFEHWKDCSTIRDRVEMELTEKADGMFRWAALQLDALRECYNKSSVEQALRNLPRTLYDTYTRTLDIIRAGPHGREVVLILQMLVWSGEPLSPDACNDAIAVKPEQVPGFDKDDRFFGTSYIVKICAGLIITVNTSWGIDHLRLAHASVNDYLLSLECSKAFADQLSERIARVSVLRTCFTYLHCLDWGITKNLHQLEIDYPFARWAATCWLQIVKIIDNMHDLTALVVHFLQSDSFPFEPFFRYMFQRLPRAEEGQCFPLYLAAYAGLERSSRYLIQSELVFSVSGLRLPAPVTQLTPELDRIFYLHKQIRTMNNAGGLHDRPRPHSADIDDLQSRLDASLVVASIQGHREVVRDLLYYGASPDAIDCLQDSHLKNLNALQLAAEHGHSRIVQLLIDSGSAIDFYEEGQYDGTALYQASRAGNIEVVRTLIASGANVNINCGLLGNALMAAIDSASDHAELVQVLIDAGADYSQTVQTRSPLQLASTRGNTRIVQVLINKGVHINTIGACGTALKLAAEYGREEVLELLLVHGADVELRQISAEPRNADRTLRNSDWTPLQAAVASDYIEVAKRLLHHGAHVDALSSSGTALVIAAECHYFSNCVQLLIDAGARPDGRDDQGRTALQKAAKYGTKRISVVRALLDHSMSFDAVRHDGKVLASDALEDRLQTLELLTHNATQVDEADRRDPPFRKSRTMEYKEIVGTLLQNVLHVMFADLIPDGLMSDDLMSDDLASAASSGDLETVKVLLEQGRSPNLLDQSGYTPLQAAAREGHIDVVQKLIECGAHVDMFGLRGTALAIAAESGHIDLVQILLEGGADPDRDDHYVLSHEASCQEYADIALRILEHTVHTDDLAPRGLVWTFASDSAYIDIARVLPNTGLEVNLQTALQEKAWEGHVNVVRKLLQRRAQVNTSNTDGTALEIAAQSGHLDVVKVLLKYDADIEKGSWTPLQRAAHHGHVQIVQELLEHGADVYANAEHVSALLQAVLSDRREIVQLLLSHGALPDGNDEGESSPLQYAARRGFTSMMLILLEAGADIHARGDHGCALEQAVRCGQNEAVRMLLERGARAEGTMEAGMSTPLQIASSKGHKTILRILLHYGASIDTWSRDGCALEQAVSAENYEIVVLLLKRGALC